MSDNAGKIFVISGPSGSGKNTVLKLVFEKLNNVFFSVSATTRAPREGEVDGVNYHFVSRDEFEKMINNNELIEYAKYVDNYYGTPSKPIYEHVAKGDNVFLDIEVQGHEQLCKKIPEAISIFIAPPSLAVLEQRLRKRSTETEDKILKRLETAKIEMQQSSKYNYVVINDIAQEAADEIVSIVNSTRKI